MYITFTYLDKATKAAAKSISSRSKMFPIYLGKKKYSIIEANEHIQKLSHIIYSNNIHSNKVSSARFLIVLIDSEGLVETPGTTYEFGPIDYPIEGGLGASLVEVIKKDIYADTDENMSVEESYRNEKLIEQLDKALDGLEESDKEEVEALEEQQPWERSSMETDLQEDSIDQEIEAERQAEEFEQIQNEENEAPEEIEDTESFVEKAISNDSQEPKQFFDYEAYISPISDSSELFLKQDQELEEMTSVQTLIDNLPEEEPWLNEKIKQYLQNKYAQSDVSNLKQMFNRTRQEALSEARSLLSEQYRNIQEDKVEERAFGQLAASMNELNEQFADEVQQFVGNLEEKWQKREQELLDKETQEIERISKEIQGKYFRIKSKEREEQDEKIAQFTAKEQAKLEREKEQLLELEKAEIIKEHDETLTQVRIEVKKKTEDHIKSVFTNAVQVIQDKNKEVLAAVSEQVIRLKEEQEREQRAQVEAAEKKRKEEIAQQRIQLQKEKQALRKKELQLKEMELGKVTAAPSSSQNQPLVVTYPPASSNDQGDSKTDQLIEELRNEVQQLKQANMQQSDGSSSKHRKLVNGLLISGMILGSLIIGGISAGMYNHFSGNDVKADVQTSSMISQSSEKQPEVIAPEKDSEEVKDLNNAADLSDQEKIREFLFEAGNKEQLESFNNAYPTTVGDLEIAILNNHAVNALKAYEKLSESEKKELGQAQKIAVKAYYTANNEIAKAEEVK